MQGQLSEIPESPENRDYKSLIREAIETSPTKIEEDLNSTNNGWLAAFINRVSIIDSLVESGKLVKAFTPEQLTEIEKQRQIIEQKIEALKLTHGSKDKIFPDYKKNGLLGELSKMKLVMEWN